MLFPVNQVSVTDPEPSNPVGRVRFRASLSSGSSCRTQKLFQLIFIPCVLAGGASIPQLFASSPPPPPSLCRQDGHGLHTQKIKIVFPPRLHPGGSLLFFDLRLRTTCCHVKASTVCIRDVCHGGSGGAGEGCRERGWGWKVKTEVKVKV